MRFKYVLTADNEKAVAIHSSLGLFELKALIRDTREKIHKDGRDTIFKIGFKEFINPEIKTLEDFGNECPYLIGLKD